VFQQHLVLRQPPARLGLPKGVQVLLLEELPLRLLPLVRRVLVHTPRLSVSRRGVSLQLLLDLHFFKISWG
jgi:hypothetical protein